MIGWLEANGCYVEHCADLDIHEDTNLVLPGSYNLLFSVGHGTGVQRCATPIVEKRKQERQEANYIRSTLLRMRLDLPLF